MSLDLGTACIQHRATSSEIPDLGVFVMETYYSEREGKSPGLLSSKLSLKGKAGKVISQGFLSKATSPRHTDKIRGQPGATLPLCPYSHPSDLRRDTADM